MESYAKSNTVALKKKTTTTTQVDPLIVYLTLSLQNDSHWKAFVQKQSVELVGLKKLLAEMTILNAHGIKLSQLFSPISYKMFRTTLLVAGLFVTFFFSILVLLRFS